MHIIEIKYKGKLQHFKFGEREVGHSASRPRALFTCHIRLMWSCCFFSHSHSLRHYRERRMGSFQWTTLLNSDQNSLQDYHASHVMVSFWKTDIKKTWISDTFLRHLWVWELTTLALIKFILSRQASFSKNKIKLDKEALLRMSNLIWTCKVSQSQKKIKLMSNYSIRAKSSNTEITYTNPRFMSQYSKEIEI